MEDTFRNQLLQSDPVLGSVTGMRPPLLMGTGTLGEAAGLKKIRAGVEGNPALGFTVQRADVGAFMFKNVVKEAGQGKWKGEMASLTA